MWQSCGKELIGLADGKKWHTETRLSHNGKPCRWEGRILTWMDEQIHQRGQLAPTDWSQRHVVEIAAPTKSSGWFAHFMTGMDWVVRLAFRVAKNTFKQ